MHGCCDREGCHPTIWGNHDLVETGADPYTRCALALLAAYGAAACADDKGSPSADVDELPDKATLRSESGAVSTLQ
jgi:hypothetical protein